METYLVCVVIVGVLASTVTSNCVHRRTTEEFRDLFVGKCLYFQTVINPDIYCESPKNCTELWLLFQSSFSYQSRCNVDRENYRAFMAASQHSVPSNKSIFWEEVYSLVTRYTNQGRRLTSISDTLSGYLGDNMKWCGNSSFGLEEDYQNCPGYEVLPNCNSSAERAFWTIASEFYAKQASGKIHIMMNAAIQPSFANSSYFATWELPNINPSKVHEATILMAHNLGQKARETCYSLSIKTLTGILENKGIRTTCIDNPRDIMLMQCADSPSAEECKELLLPSTAAGFHSWSLFSLFCFICVYTDLLTN